MSSADSTQLRKKISELKYKRINYKQKKKEKTEYGGKQNTVSSADGQYQIHV